MKSLLTSLAATAKRGGVHYIGYLFFYIPVVVIFCGCGVLSYHFTGELGQAALANDLGTLTRFLIILSGVTGVKALAYAAEAFFTGRFSGGAAYRLRKSFAEHFVFLRFLDFEKMNGGETLSLYANDMPKSAEFVTGNSLGFIMEIINVVIVFIYMMLVNPLYTLIYMAMFPLLVFMQTKFSQPIQVKAAAMSLGKAKFNAVVNDSLANVSTVTAYSLETVMEERYLAAYNEYFKAFKSYIKSLLSLVISGIMASFTPILFIYIVAGISTVNNNMSISEFIAFTGIAALAGSWLIMLSQRLLQLRNNAASAKRVLDNTDGAAEDLTGGVTPAPGGDLPVAFERVVFGYKPDAPVLKGVSFEIKKGGKYAIVGPSGGGKSTLLKLLLGLYEPDGGAVLVNGTPVSSLSKRLLRGQLAYVPQDSFMFPVSIRENLTFNNDGVTEQTLREACANAGILSFIDSLPGGFDTALAESAENISGGQRQRLAIVRAFLQDAPIVLFDEATAALDPLTEAAVLKAFGVLMKDKTVIMVAHRQAAIAACDSVIMLVQGEVAAAGSHEELIVSNPLYKSLYEHMDDEQPPVQAFKQEGGEMIYA